ncbi:MAG: M14 family zinc carboxypeptidase, partial [Myxococcota bacterium]|nr:M14 family zinc carboxypeptidase [Myxococcota bacterium]
MTWLLMLAVALATPPDFASLAEGDGRSLRGEPLPPEVSAYLRWAGMQSVTPHPEPAYRFDSDVHAELRAIVAAMPERVTPVRVGRSVENRPIWGFRIREHRTPVSRKLLVFANIHALEWITTEVATRFLVELAAHPPPGVE